MPSLRDPRLLPPLLLALALAGTVACEARDQGTIPGHGGSTSASDRTSPTTDEDSPSPHPTRDGSEEPTAGTREPGPTEPTGATDTPGEGTRSTDTSQDCRQSRDVPTTRRARDNERLVHGQVAVIGHIIDGDTFDLVVDGVAYRTRILGLDAPECEKEQKPVGGMMRFRCVEHSDNDHWGWESYCEMVRLASMEEVVVSCEGTVPGEACPLDVYDRTLAYVDRTSDGADLGEALVRAGGAWSFTRYESERRATYCDAEEDAIADGLGMWAIGRDAVLARMDDGTRRWYRDRDARCEAARR